MNIMQILLFILQAFGFLLFIDSATNLKNLFKIKITFSNLPISIMMFLFVLIGSYICITHFLWYMLIGLIITVFFLIITSLAPENKIVDKLQSKLISSAISLFFWPHLIIIIMMILFNANNLNNEKF